MAGLLSKKPARGGDGGEGGSAAPAEGAGAMREDGKLGCDGTNPVRCQKDFALVEVEVGFPCQIFPRGSNYKLP